MITFLMCFKLTDFGIQTAKKRNKPLKLESTPAVEIRFGIGFLIIYKGNIIHDMCEAREAWEAPKNDITEN